MLKPWREALNRTVVVAALGYFVDIYDLVLFSIVRIPSLQAIGITGDDLLEKGVFLLNTQMIGMLLGGVIWGILGDKRGRVSVLFGSIFLYSTANIANAFVTTFDQYVVLRFLAGVGLAGELGAAITLVSEVMPKHTRGYGTAIVAGVGVTGAIFAGWIAEVLSWQSAYLVGGVLGLLLLVMRMKMFDSGMYERAKSSAVVRGSITMLFRPWPRFKKYLFCILIGLPTWYVVGVLVTFSPEIAKALGVTEEVSAGRAIMFAYTGLVFGDFASGAMSQALKSRKKVVYLFVSVTAFFSGVYLLTPQPSATFLYTVIFLMGLSSGYWAIFVQIAAEQFGTNLRATVTTTVPNFVRGATVLLTYAFQSLRVEHGLVQSALWVGVVAFAISLTTLGGLKETFGADLDYVEE